MNNNELNRLFIKAGITRNKMCELTGISAATLTKYLQKNYTGRYYDKIHKCLINYLESENINYKDETKTLNNQTTTPVMSQPVTQTTTIKPTYVESNTNTNQNYTYLSLRFPAPKRGEIYYVLSSNSTFKAMGHEQKANRPAIVVSENGRNARSKTVQVIYTTTRTKADLPTHVDLDSKYEDLPKDSTAQCEQVITVDKTLLTRKIGDISEEKLNEIDKALTISLDLDIDEEPNTENNETPIEECNKSSDGNVQVLESQIKILIEQSQKDKMEIEVLKAENAIYKRFFESQVSII